MRSSGGLKGMSGVAKQEGTGIMGRKDDNNGNIQEPRSVYMCVCVCGGGGGGGGEGGGVGGGGYG